MDTQKEASTPVRPSRATQTPKVTEDTAVAEKPAQEPHVAADGLPRRNSEQSPKTASAKRKDSNFGAPSPVYMSEALVKNSTVNTFDLLDENFLKQYMNEDCIITLDVDTPEYYAYSDALQAGAVPVNNYEQWKKGVKFPPVRVKLPSGGYTYMNAGSRYTKGDEYYCRVLLTEDFSKDIKRTISNIRGNRPVTPTEVPVPPAPAPVAPVAPVATPAPVTQVAETIPPRTESKKEESAPVAEPAAPKKRKVCSNMPKHVAESLAPWDKVDAHYTYVDAEETLDGYLANFNADPLEAEVIDEASLPPVANEEEAEARAAILKWINGSKDRKPLLDSIMNPAPEPDDEYPILNY